MVFCDGINESAPHLATSLQVPNICPFRTKIGAFERSQKTLESLRFDFCLTSLHSKLWGASNGYLPPQKHRKNNHSHGQTRRESSPKGSKTSFMACISPTRPTPRSPRNLRCTVRLSSALSTALSTGSSCPTTPGVARRRRTRRRRQVEAIIRGFGPTFSQIFLCFKKDASNGEIFLS